MYIYKYLSHVYNKIMSYPYMTSLFMNQGSGSIRQTSTTYMYFIHTTCI